MVPKWNRTTALWLIGAALLTLAGPRALRRAVAAGAEGHGPPREAPPPRAALLRRPLRLQRAAEHHRRRRAAGVPALPRASTTPTRPTPSPRWCSSGSPAGWCCPLITFFGLAHQPRPPRAGPGQSRSPRRSPPAPSSPSCVVLLVADHPRLGGPLRRERGLDPLRRRRPPGRRPDARPPAAAARRGAGRPRLPARRSWPPR